MQETDRDWFEDQIKNMADEHSKALNAAEYRGYWNALGEFDRDVIVKVTNNTSQWSRHAPKAFDLRERATTETNRAEGFESPENYQDDPEFAEPPTVEQVARWRAIVKGICERKAKQREPKDQP